MTELNYHVDDQDNVIGKVDHNDVIEKGVLNRGVGVVVFNSKGEIFVHQRSHNKKIFPGYYDYAFGGSVIVGESYEQAAARELEEETGISNVEIKPLIDFNWRSDTLNYNAQVFYCLWDGEINIQKEEIEKGFFVSLEEFEKMLKTEKFCDDMVEMWKKCGDKIKNEAK
ncbi:NUDIX domain-containing protein [Candidatus Woesearchaeota archaeon]|nr:NUDIX domain-containing protein [Candidatus Woesearchaeota archaeon]